MDVYFGLRHYNSSTNSNQHIHNLCTFPFQSVDAFVSILQRVLSDETDSDNDEP